MRTVQEIFDTVIDAGLYHGRHAYSKKYMCYALRAAYRANVITMDDVIAAEAALLEYLSFPGEALEGYLYEHDLPLEAYGHLPEGSIFWDFTKLYRDWANRPMPEAPALADLQESNQEHHHE